VVRRAHAFPHAHLGRHRHRRAQGVGIAIVEDHERSPAPGTAARSAARLRRRHEHRAHLAHGPSEGRCRGGARRRDPSCTTPSRRGRARDTTEASAFLDAIRGVVRGRRSVRSTRRRRRAAAARSPRRSPGFVRHTLANYLRQTGAEVVTLRAGSRTARSEKCPLTWSFCRPAPALRRTSTYRGRSPDARAELRCWACASACKRHRSNTSAESSRLSTTGTRASHRAIDVRGGTLFKDCQLVPRRPLSLPLRDPKRSRRPGPHRLQRRRRLMAIEHRPSP